MGHDLPEPQKRTYPLKRLLFIVLLSWIAVIGVDFFLSAGLFSKRQLRGGMIVPSLKAFFTNMSAPMSLRKKLYLAFRNQFIKIWKRQSCCGHHGEPGC
ncbi:MAG: hypothetical protein A2074_00920 [Candidatus Aquicultor primus]|uniref:Uncharacterized protein n=1 Tax=Candidatus Aquicultor primus TaxID=1797195 RepID=A0A1F2UWS3_9ACTN|nr:MAG: hypothetical protein A2074_00920 [Candidatus Aquicultor primus]HCH00193.1 hypothetical protein [Actinomycetota bacterium]